MAKALGVTNMIIQIDVTDGRILSWGLLEGSYDLENDNNVVETLEYTGVDEENYHEYLWSEGGTFTHSPLPVHAIDGEESLDPLDFLNQTDWYVIRNQETGADIPQDILTARAEARASIV